MIVTSGYILSGVISAGIIFIGLRFFLTPYTAATDFGVAVAPDVHWSAFLSVKAIRDIASGLFIAILMLTRSPHVLGWFMLAATLIPLTDATIVLNHDGAKTIAYRIHGSTAAIMLLTSALLLFGG